VTPGDIIQDLTGILEETSPRCREVIERAIKEIEERDAEIVNLKNDLVEKDATIEEQDQHFVSFFKFCVEALNDATEALEVVCPGKETHQFLDETDEAVKTATPEGRPYAVMGRVRQIIERIKETPPLVIETEKMYTYTTRTRVENRALALVDHIKTTWKNSLKSTEARTILETHEGRPLDRKIVWRALEVAQGILRATVDKVGGVGRLVLSTPRPSLEQHEVDLHHHENRLGGGGELSRPRRSRVNWDTRSRELLHRV
jgi:hypothetical protein